MSAAQFTSTLSILVGATGRIPYVGALELVAGVSLALKHNLPRAVDLTSVNRVTRRGHSLVLALRATCVVAEGASLAVAHSCDLILSYEHFI